MHPTVEEAPIKLPAPAQGLHTLQCWARRLWDHVQAAERPCLHSMHNPNVLWKPLPLTVLSGFFSESLESFVAVSKTCRGRLQTCKSLTKNETSSFFLGEMESYYFLCSWRMHFRKYLHCPKGLQINGSVSGFIVVLWVSRKLLKYLSNADYT